MEVVSLRTESPLRNLSHLILFPNSQEAIAIDPYSAPTILDFLRKNSLKLKAILNTHEHADHTKGNLELQRETGAPVFGHKNASEKIPGFSNHLESEKSLFADGDEKILSWETPGHTLCHFSFAIEKGSSIWGVFSGDTVFNAGVGNCYRGGNVSLLFQTIQSRFLSLPDTCFLFPGHDYWNNNLDFAVHCGVSDVEINDLRAEASKRESEDSYLLSNFGLERKINPFFQNLNEQKFAELRKQRDEW